MAEPLNDGGQAFPAVEFEYSEWRGGNNQPFPYTPSTRGGMSLRDYFAAKALAGQIAFEGAEGCGNDGGSADVAAWCYEIADAMLKAREAK